MTIRLRAFRREDAETLAVIFLRAIREGTAGAYTLAQQQAWANMQDAPKAWAERLESKITLVAERDGQVGGFMTLGADGYLDLAFVLPEEKGRGLAAALHDRMLHEAHLQGVTRLTTDASIVARRFFLKQGWREQAEQQLLRDGQSLTNYRMDKRIAPDGVSATSHPA